MFFVVVVCTQICFCGLFLEQTKQHHNGIIFLSFYGSVCLLTVQWVWSSVWGEQLVVGLLQLNRWVLKKKLKLFCSVAQASCYDCQFLSSVAFRDFTHTQNSFERLNLWPEVQGISDAVRCFCVKEDAALNLTQLATFCWFSSCFCFWPGFLTLCWGSSHTESVAVQNLPHSKHLRAFLLVSVHMTLLLDRKYRPWGKRIQNYCLTKHPTVSNAFKCSVMMRLLFSDPVQFEKTINLTNILLVFFKNLIVHFYMSLCLATAFWWSGCSSWTGWALRVALRPSGGGWRWAWSYCCWWTSSGWRPLSSPR